MPRPEDIVLHVGCDDDRARDRARCLNDLQEWR